LTLLTCYSLIPILPYQVHDMIALNLKREHGRTSGR
jgi:hypothetical protein